MTPELWHDVARRIADMVAASVAFVSIAWCVVVFIKSDRFT